MLQCHSVESFVYFWVTHNQLLVPPYGVPSKPGDIKVCKKIVPWCVFASSGENTFIVSTVSENSFLAYCVKCRTLLEGFEVVP